MKKIQVNDMNFITIKTRSGLIKVDVDAIGHAEYSRLDPLDLGGLSIWPHAEATPIHIERNSDKEAFDALIAALDTRAASGGLLSSDYLDFEPYGYDKPRGSINGRQTEEKLYVTPSRLGEIREIHDGRGDVYVVAGNLPYVRTTPSKTQHGHVHATSESFTAPIDFKDHHAQKLGRALKILGFARLTAPDQTLYVNSKMLAAVYCYTANNRHFVEMLFDHKTHRIEFRAIMAARNAAFKLAADLNLEVLVHTGDYIAVNPTNLRMMALGQDEFGGRISYDCLYLTTAITHKLHLRAKEVVFVRDAIEAISDFLVVNATGKSGEHEHNLIAINRGAACGLVVRQNRVTVLDANRQVATNSELPCGVEITRKVVDGLKLKLPHLVQSGHDFLGIDISQLNAVLFEPHGDMVFVTVVAGKSATAGASISKEAASRFAEALKSTYRLPLFESAKQVVFLRAPIAAKSPEFGSFQITLESGGIVECNREIFDLVRSYLKRGHRLSRPMRESDFQAA